MPEKSILIAMGFLSILFGSCSRSNIPETSPPEITSAREVEGFQDLIFKIEKRERLADGSHSIQILGTHKGQNVGLIVVLGSRWKKYDRNSEIPFASFIGNVGFRSVGAPSDRLLKVLDQLYATGMRPTTMRADTQFTGWSLEGEPGNLSAGEAKIKLFFEPDSEDRYAELYTNIDLAKGIVEIKEKDPEYRASIIRVLSSE